MTKSLVTPCSGCTRGGVSLRFAAQTFTELAGVVIHLLVYPLDYVVCDYVVLHLFILTFQFSSYDTDN